MSRSAPTTGLSNGEDLAQVFRAMPGAEANRFVLLSGAPVAGLSSDVAIGDWDDLLNAVKSRLRLTVGELQAVLPEHTLPDAAHRIQASVLECVSALDQLHITLTHELGRRQRLELEVLETRNALARMRAELAASLLGSPPSAA